MDSRPLRSLLERLRRTTATPGDGLSDAELLLRFVRQRDEAAFELLVWRHGPMVLGVCRRVLRDAHAAEDAFQATFLALARKASTISRGGAVAPWLCRVAFRVALRARAAAAKRAAQALPADFPDPRASGRAERDWQPILDEEINALPERYRRPVVLCHLQGYTLAEAARQLGCPRGTVAVRLVRARQRLRARLTRRGVALTAVLAAALASESVVSAALVKATVYPALGYALDRAAGAVPPSVLTLTEGVLHAMFLSKMKVVAAVLLATVLAGAGATWLTYRSDAGEQRPDGSGARAASPPDEARPAPKNDPQRRAEDERDLAERRRVEQQDRLARAEKLLVRTEETVAAREQQWLEEVIDARVRVMELREDLEVKERELDDEAKAADPARDFKLGRLLAERDRAVQQLAEMKKVRDKENDAVIQKLSKEVEALDDAVDVRQRELQKEAADLKKRRLQGLANLRQQRRDLLVAEEKFQALQRRQAWQRAEAQRDLEEQAQRVRQWRQALDDAEFPRAPTGGPAADTEKKLDQVLRELAELRRALQPAKDKRPEEP
jgi:RNA polymerase sigma factor (sigma-70 family)